MLGGMLRKMWEAAVPAVDGEPHRLPTWVRLLVCLFSALCYRLLQTFFYNCLKHNFVFLSVEGGIRLAVLCHLWSPLQGPLVALPTGTLNRDQRHCAPGLGTLSPVESRVPCFPTVQPPKPLLAQLGSGLRARCRPQVQRPRAHHGPAMNHWAPPLHSGSRELWQMNADPGSLPHPCGHSRCGGAPAR